MKKKKSGRAIQRVAHNARSFCTNIIIVTCLNVVLYTVAQPKIYLGIEFTRPRYFNENVYK